MIPVDSTAVSVWGVLAGSGGGAVDDLSSPVSNDPDHRPLRLHDRRRPAPPRVLELWGRAVSLGRPALLCVRRAGGHLPREHAFPTEFAAPSVHARVHGAPGCVRGLSPCHECDYSEKITNCSYKWARPPPQ